jgi:hypothetical protein
MRLLPENKRGSLTGKRDPVFSEKRQGSAIPVFSAGPEWYPNGGMQWF